MSQDFEKQVFEKGQELLKPVLKPDKLFDFKKKTGWYRKILVWTLNNQKFKSSLFRFIDVLPNLSDDKQFLSHWEEYFKDQDIRFVTSALAKLSPSLFVSSVKKQLLEVARLFITGADSSSALKVIAKNWEKNVAFSIDLLGEATLSEKEALFYQSRYLQLIEEVSQQRWPDKALLQKDSLSEIALANISIKPSALYSQIKPLAWQDSKTQIKNRLRPLLETAVQKKVFINLDMEHYKYKDLYLELFKELLMEEPFRHYPHLGIAIQAYLKDSLEDLKALIRFSEKRGQTLQIRLVKGAYWDSELLLSQQKNWPVPVFTEKQETDNNYEKALALLFEASPAIKIAVASHNVRSLACALVHKEKRPQAPLEFQFLYGMLESLALYLADKGHLSRIYCPVGALIPGMSYFVRRLLENSSNQSFVLKAMMGGLGPDKLLAPLQILPNKPFKKSPSQSLFTKALRPVFKRTEFKKLEIQRPGILKTSSLDRLGGDSKPKAFFNHPLPDFSQAPNRKAFEEALKAWKTRFPIEVPILLKGIRTNSPVVFKRENPSCPDQIISQTFFANRDRVKEAVLVSKGFFPQWKNTSPAQRISYLRKTAKLLQEKFFYFASLQVFEVGKTWNEACGDVCEAIDFCSYYACLYEKLARGQLTDKVSGEESFLHWTAKGPTAVIAPWNFPLAILVGMTVAPLVCGNTVLIKPAEQSTLSAYEFVKVLLTAGFPKESFAFLPGRGEEVGEELVSSPEVSVISFTGSFKVGQKILESASKMSEKQKAFKSCVVEMGGKNAIIIDSSADLDATIEGVLISAFAFQGQKCSACSRLIIVADIYKPFMERFLPAMESLLLGDPEKPESFLGPLVDKEAFQKIKDFVFKEKAMLLYPQSKDKIFKEPGYFMSPVVYLSEDPQSALMQEELFAPILACYKVPDIQKAFLLANQSRFALTAGLYSRHPGHIESFKAQAEGGNLYINRPCTGAVVKRHPFGGWKMSGLGSKAGGEDYLKAFLHSKVSTENRMRRGFSPEIF